MSQEADSPAAIPLDGRFGLTGLSRLKSKVPSNGNAKNAFQQLATTKKKKQKQSLLAICKSNDNLRNHRAAKHPSKNTSPQQKVPSGGSSQESPPTSMCCHSSSQRQRSCQCIVTSNIPTFLPTYNLQLTTKTCCKMLEKKL